MPEIPPRRTVTAVESPSPKAKVLKSPTKEGSGRRFVANIGWMLLSQGAAKIAGFAFVIIVARGLGTSEYGYFNFALSLVPLFLMVGAWGIGIVVITEVARNVSQLSEIVASAFIVRIGLAAIGLLLCFVTTPLFVSGGGPILTVIVVGCALFLDEISGFLSNVFMAFERMRYQALTTVTNRIVSALLAIVAIDLGGKLIWVSAMYLLGSLGALVFAVTAIKRRLPPIRLRDRRRSRMRQFLGQGTLVGVASVLNMALFRIDTVMLQAMRGSVDVGMYGIAYRFLDSFLFFVWGVTHAGLSRLARAVDGSERKRSFESVGTLLLAFYVPVAVCGLFSSSWMVSTLFSSRYAAAVPAVPWLAGAGLFYAIAYLARVSAIVDGRRSAIVWIAVIGVIVNVGANAVVIPRHGFVGAAIVTLGSEILDAALLLALYTRLHGRPWASALPAVPLTAGCCMSAILLLLPASGGVQLAIGALTYVIALTISGSVIAPAESRKALALLRRRPPVASAG